MTSTMKTVVLPGIKKRRKQNMIVLVLTEDNQKFHKNETTTFIFTCDVLTDNRRSKST